MPKISVIIPIYNVEKYIKECLSSVVNQTLKDIEIICVNDGSKDNSRDIAAEFAQNDNRIKIIDQENSGLSAARNVGIKAASGEYVAFVDSDDRISLNFLEALYNAAKQNGADVACTNIVRFYPKEKKFLEYKNVQVAQNVKEKYELGHVPEFNYVWNKIYKREALINLGLLFQEGKVYEDIVFTHKALYFLGKMVSVPDACYYYRYTSGSLANNKKNKPDYLENFKLAIDFVKANNIVWKYIDKYPYYQKDKFIFCGLPVMTMKRFLTCDKLYLLGILPLGKIIHNRRY